MTVLQDKIKNGYAVLESTPLGFIDKGKAFFTLTLKICFIIDIFTVLM